MLTEPLSAEITKVRNGYFIQLSNHFLVRGRTYVTRSLEEALIWIQRWLSLEEEPDLAPKD